MPDTRRTEQIATLLLAYREALITDNGNLSSTSQSASLRMSDLWQAGQHAFKELERCLDQLAATRPIQLEHLRGCYGIPPFTLPKTRTTLKRRGHNWIGLKPNQRITATPLPDAWNRAGKPVTVDIEVIVETWPTWIRQEKVRRALHALADDYRNGGEIYIPTEFAITA